MAKIAPSLRLNSEEIDAMMRSEGRMRIATMGPGDKINMTPMGFGWAGGCVYTFGRGQKVANLRRNATATVLVDVGSAWRELQGVMFHGTAKVLETSEDELADPYLAEAQLNIGQKAGLRKDGQIVPHAASASGRSRRWIVFTPESVVSWDNTKLPNQDDH